MGKPFGRSDDPAPAAPPARRVPDPEVDRARPADPGLDPGLDLPAEPDRPTDSLDPVVLVPLDPGDDRVGSALGPLPSLPSLPSLPLALSKPVVRLRPSPVQSPMGDPVLRWVVPSEPSLPPSLPPALQPALPRRRSALGLVMCIRGVVTGAGVSAGGAGTLAVGVAPGGLTLSPALSAGLGYAWDGCLGA